MSIKIWKEKKKDDFQVRVTIEDDVNNFTVSGFMDVVNLQDFETKLAAASDNAIKNGLAAEYKTLLRTIN